MMSLFDSHNHLHSERFGKDAGTLVEEMKREGIRGCVVNATREDDWAAVAELARSYKGFVRPAYGIHPWFAHTAKEGWEGRLKVLLENDSNATVGEFGLDGWVDSPGLEIQREVFGKQMGLARELSRVATIHCLKAWEPLFEQEVWPEKFLMHSFGGSIEIAERLMKQGDAYFSFSGYFFQERKAKVLEVYRQLPRERILLETDAPEMLPPADLVAYPLEGDANHPGNLGRIARVFEQELGQGILEQVAENERRLWGI